MEEELELARCLHFVAPLTIAMHDRIRGMLELMNKENRFFIIGWIPLYGLYHSNQVQGFVGCRTMPLWSICQWCLSNSQGQE
jgi:hypothetical protein